MHCKTPHPRPNRGTSRLQSRHPGPPSIGTERHHYTRGNMSEWAMETCLTFVWEAVPLKLSTSVSPFILLQLVVLSYPLWGDRLASSSSMQQHNGPVHIGTFNTAFNTLINKILQKKIGHQIQLFWTNLSIWKKCQNYDIKMVLKVSMWTGLM